MKYSNNIRIFQLLLLICMGTNYTNSQTCLPDGIILKNQREIDSFSILYPDCTHILGDLRINSVVSDVDTVNLLGLKQVTRIDGGLRIFANYKLRSLLELQNLDTIGYLSLEYNTQLQNLLGLENCKILDRSAYIVVNRALQSLEGFPRIDSLENLEIFRTRALKNLKGLEQLDHITNFVLRDNDSLNSFIGLDSLTSCEDLLVWENPSLGSFAGLSSLRKIDTLEIFYNNALTSLGQLSRVKKLNFLRVRRNDSLESLIGLEGIQTIGRVQIWDNLSLINLSGLGGLTTISGIQIEGNSKITNLGGLENLVSVNGEVSINNNKNLTSLSGIENVNTSSISHLNIYRNHQLEFCSENVICEYLEILNASHYIENNGAGCNSSVEITEKCMTSTSDHNHNEAVIYPNPSSSSISISGISSGRIRIYDELGGLVLTTVLGQKKIDVSHLKSGLYILKIEQGADNLVMKMIISK